MNIDNYHVEGHKPGYRTFLMEHYELMKRALVPVAVLFLVLCLEI